MKKNAARQAAYQQRLLLLTKSAERGLTMPGDLAKHVKGRKSCCGYEHGDLALLARLCSQPVCCGNCSKCSKLPLTGL